MSVTLQSLMDTANVTISIHSTDIAHINDDVRAMSAYLDQLAQVNGYVGDWDGDGVEELLGKDMAYIAMITIPNNVCFLDEEADIATVIVISDSYQELITWLENLTLRVVN